MNGISKNLVLFYAGLRELIQKRGFFFKNKIIMLNQVLKKVVFLRPGSNS